MEANTTIALREELESQRASLRRELGELGYGSEGGLSYDTNFADTSQVTAERGETETLVKTLTTDLADVERAIAKIDAGSYGSCESCHGEIVAARLEAMPAARYCISCAGKRR
jgi:RNA polymerase-binding transcription factor DksA